jgi:uncharacterized protein (TIGR03437 family)
VYEPTIRLSGVDQEVLGSFYAPQLTAVYQVNLRIGADVPSGEHPIEVLHEGLKGHPLLLPVGVP